MSPEMRILSNTFLDDVVFTRFQEPAYHGVIIRGLYDLELQNEDRRNNFANESEEKIEEACKRLEIIAREG